jgi:formamidopyrimidine-DNA glycosylase
MPELPDVQVFQQYLDSNALRQRIRDVELSAAGMLAGVSGKTLRTKLIRRELVATRRHGKNLFVRLAGDGWLFLHFGMTGALKYFGDAERPPEFTRLRLDFANGHHLAYVNMRKLGKIGLVDDVDAFIAEQKLGPDALDLDLAGFRRALAGRRGKIKATLMDQTVMAGIGNIYADEVLFAAGVDPRARTERLASATVRELHKAMRAVLAKAIEAGADVDNLPRSFLLPHRARGGRCPKCGRMLRQIKLGGRTTYLCPRHQRKKA